jgi:hypothetical protein
MGDTVEAVAHKTEVAGRVKEAASEKLDSVRSKLSGAIPDSGERKRGARRGAGTAQENPLGLGIAAVVAGLLAGLLGPSTKVEDEKIGRLADQVKRRRRRPGRRR